MKKLYKGLKISLFAIILISSCSVFAQGTYKNGVFVLNEGGTNTSSVSFISNDADAVAQNDIYTTVNPTQGPLGTIGQSIAFNGNYAYIVMNVSNTIKVVNRDTFEYVTTISTGLNNPRYIAFTGGKGYITNWGDSFSNDDDYVAVLNLENNTIGTTTIPMSFGVEKISEINGKLYVAHKGGYSYGNLISVIDPVSNTIEDTITVGDVPEAMVVADGFLYVLCSGKPDWSGAETFGKLVKIDLASNTVTSEIEFPSQHPLNLKMDTNNTIYYTIDADIYQTTLAATSLPTEPLFSIDEQGAYGIYGMDVIDGKIYIADAENYISAGHVYVYSTAGILLDDYVVGLIPNGFYKATPLQYAPDAPNAGSTAVAKDSPLFVAWATGITVERGFVNKSNPDLVVSGSNKASYGVPENAIGFPDGNLVSLGDEGNAILTFAAPIYDGDGFDLAVFENGAGTFLELAFVEASSDGVNFFRFPTHSLTSTLTQTSGFGATLSVNLHNFAGKYSGTNGVPFDISELPDNALLDKNNITHIKVIDVVGSVNPLYATYDSHGNAVNDPFPTPFNSCGFDLQAVGVIHQLGLGIANPGDKQLVSLYPNPAKGRVYINAAVDAEVKIIDASGRTVINTVKNTTDGIDVSSLSSGVYFTVINSDKGSSTLRLLIQ